MPSKGRDKSSLEQPDGHIPVHWLDAPIVPTRWEQWDSRWINLPAALLIVVVVLAILVPEPSVSIPAASISLPAADFSLANGDDDDDDGAERADPATPVAPGLQSVLADLAIPATPAVATPAPEVARQPADPTEAVEVADVVSMETPPDELGRVPIIMYHAFVHDPAYTDEWTLTFDQFRAQLDWFRENDFVMVGMQSMVDGTFDVPAGKKPIILTFDDASAGQFGLQAAEGGGYEVKPDTAVGIIEEYRQMYPEFAGTAFLAVLPWNCFSSDDDPSSCEERLNWLVEHDYEIGNHTYDHVDMTDVTDEFFTESIGSMKNWIDERIPQGKGNLSSVLVLPFGAYPDPELHPDQRAWMTEGFWYLGEPVNLDIVLGVNGGPAVSPFSQIYAPSQTFRIASEPGVLAYWQEEMTSGASPVFVSDGDPGVVTVPAGMEEYVNLEALEPRGLELRVYDDGE